MEALADFHVTVTFCFTPEHRGIAPHHTSAPQVKEEFAAFCASMVSRYADSTRMADPVSPAAQLENGHRLDFMPR
jgi:beta-xylosidase